MSNIQRDVISLTADKTEIFSVLDSIRTTVASIREFAEQLDNTQLEYAKDAVEKVRWTTLNRVHNDQFPYWTRIYESQLCILL